MAALSGHFLHFAMKYQPPQSKVSPETPGTTLFTQPTTGSIAVRIRKLRKSHGWSLADVESISRGKLKAVVLGSYERGDRALSIKRAIELANLYSVPLHYLLAEPESEGLAKRKTLILDLRRIRSASGIDEKSRLFATFISWIAGQRNDWNGEVMSLREGDLALLALLLISTEPGVIEWLEGQSFLFTGLSPS